MYYLPEVNKTVLTRCMYLIQLLAVWLKLESWHIVLLFILPAVDFPMALQFCLVTEHNEKGS